MAESKQIAAMYFTGYFTQRQIAQRLKVSIKTVQRAIRLHDDLESRNQVLGIVDTDEEKFLWFAYIEAGATIGTVAYLFGVSRQTVHEELIKHILGVKRLDPLFKNGDQNDK